jgi:hypothetical protein
VALLSIPQIASLASPRVLLVDKAQKQSELWLTAQKSSSMNSAHALLYWGTYMGCVLLVSFEDTSAKKWS